MSIKRFVSALLTGALCLGVLTACGSTQKPASSGVSADAQRYSTIFYDAFDTVTQVIAYCDSEEEFSRQMDALHADLLEYHRLYDIYNDYAGVVNVKTINDNAGVAPVQVDDKILGMLELARQMYDTTNGKLNIAMGSVLRIWHDYREAAEANTNEADNKLPEQEALDAAARHCDISNLVIDENARTVYLSDPDMSLDVGSVGKGYAVEMVAQAAEARGLKSALISVGGNLRAIGTKPDGSQWSGGVENPWNASDVYTASSSYVSGVNMSDMALVTSGNYQRYYVVDGVRYHHLIDPDTLWPARYFDSVSVLSPDSGAATASPPACSVCPLRMARSSSSPSTAWKPLVYPGRRSHPVQRMGRPREKVTESESPLFVTVFTPMTKRGLLYTIFRAFTLPYRHTLPLGQPRRSRVQRQAPPPRQMPLH